VTAPRNSETDLSRTVADTHVEPCATDDAKRSTVPYADGPSVEARPPNATIRCDGRTTASTPAPTHAAGSDEDASGAYDGAGVVPVVDVVVVVVPVVVVVVVVSVAVVSVVVVSVVVVSVVVDDVVSV